MRKLLLSVLLASSISSVFAQKLDDVQEKISKGKYDEAKEKIDKVLADPKNANNANAWYYKGKVYAELARQDSTGSLAYDAQAQAFDAFKKYQELDPKNVMMTLDQNVGLFTLYDLYYNQGVKKYNAKDYAAAFDKMKNALEVENYIAKKGYSYNNFSFPALDTQLINLTASAAYLAKKEDEAIPYFEQLANAKIKDKEYREIYGLLVEYYTKKGDQQKADKYLAIGRELFPDNDYWISLEFGNIPVEDTAKRLARYEYMLQKYPDNYALALDYATELFNYTYTFEKKPADYTARQEKLQKALEKTLSIQSTAFANYIMAQHIYNEIYDLDDALRLVRGTTPADQAKKKDIIAKTDKRYEEFYPFALKAYELYTQDNAHAKAQDKANYRKVINQLIDYHQRKKQADKVALYQEKLKTL
jgi:tetratricopeptide (TPR) repeat protein